MSKVSRGLPPWSWAAVGSLPVVLVALLVWRSESVASAHGTAQAAAGESEILAHRAEVLTLFRFAPNPAIVVFDFPDLHQQGLMFDRLAAFAEKLGEPHDRVLTDPELDHAIHAHGDTVETYYYGHDYSAATLRDFFALAQRDHLELNPEEQRLHALAEELGLLAPGATAAVVTVPREGADPLVDSAFRRTILRHELAHAEMLTNPAYAAYARQFWETTLDAPARDAFRRFLVAQDYDPALPDLMVNEAQAYLMHTPDHRAFSAEALGVSEAALQEYQLRFLSGMPPGWLREAAASTAKSRT